MDEKLAPAVETLIDALGRQSAFWGLGRTAGEMYAVLLLASEPVSLQEIAQSLQVTKGNISTAIRQLEQLAMVRRSWRRGDRRVFFEAETDFWKIAHSVLARRQKPEFDQSFKLVQDSTRLAEQAAPSPERDAVIGRLRSLQTFYHVLDSLVEAALAMTPEQTKGLAEVFAALKAGMSNQPTGAVSGQSKGENPHEQP